MSKSIINPSSIEIESHLLTTYDNLLNSTIKSNHHQLKISHKSLSIIKEFLIDFTLGSDHQKKDAIEFIKSQSQLQLNATMILIRWISRISDRILSTDQHQIDSELLHQFVLALNLLQGLLHLHPPSQKLFSSQFNLQILLRFLSPSLEIHELQSITIPLLDLLLTTFIDSSFNKQLFESSGGLEVLIKAMKNKQIKKEFRVKVLETVWGWWIDDELDDEDHDDSPIPKRSKLNPFQQQNTPTSSSITSTPARSTPHQSDRMRGKGFTVIYLVIFFVQFFICFDQNIRINPRSKPKLWVPPSRSSGNKLKPSLRQERDGMDPETKDDDYNMSRATQKHFRYLSGVSREKHSFPRSPTREDLEALSDLPDGTAPLGLSAPYILKPSELSQQWDHDDEMGEGFQNRCEQRLGQYGLPYVGLSSVRNDPKAEEWNRHTLEYCLDTFNCAMDGLEYEDLFRLDRAELDVNRIRDLMATHMRYCIDNKRIFLKDDSNLKEHMQEDRRAKRAMNLAARRHEACLTYEDLNVYQDMFLDRRYCLSDESDDAVLEEDQMRDIPIWRSRVGTALVEYIDAAYRQIRQDEIPKRPGRKPGKRKTSTTAPVVGSSKWPVGLPSDCYDSAWVASLKAKDRKALKMKPAALQDVPQLLD